MGKRVFCSTFVAGTVSYAGAFQANAGGPSPVVFRAEATNPSGVGLVEITFEAGVWDPENSSYEYLQELPIEIISETTGELVAWLDNCYLFFRTGSINEIQLNFSVRAVAFDTVFLAESPILQYLSVPAPEARGRAIASFSVSDQDGDGARLQGIGPGPAPGAYSAYLNTSPQSTGTQFANLVNLVDVGSGGSAVGTQIHPPSGYLPIGQVIRSSMVQFSFRTSINDAVTANTRFVTLDRSEACPGDVDADYDIDVQDLAGFLTGFGSLIGDPGYSPDVDLLADGSVDISDLGEMLSYFGSTCP